jgi:hypothetical protein
MPVIITASGVRVEFSDLRRASLMAVGFFDVLSGTSPASIRIPDPDPESKPTFPPALPAKAGGRRTSMERV